MLIMGRAQRNRNGFEVGTETAGYGFPKPDKCLNV